MSAASRLLSGLKSPWVVGFSVFGAAYGLYNVIDSTQSGTAYDLTKDLTGHTYIVTGATSGLGRAVTSKLADRNARVIMACRNRDKCLIVRRDIVLATRNKQIFCRQCDLSDFDSIEQFVAKLYKGKFEIDRIDALINSAAVMEPKRELTKDGIEKSLATNHMGPFLLTGLLLQKLLNQNHPSKIIFLETNIVTPDKMKLELDTLNDVDETQKFDGFEVYKQTKLAELLFAKELAERLDGSNVSVLAVDPGRTRTDLAGRMGFQKIWISRWILRVIGFFMGERKVEKSTRPVMYAAADDDTSQMNGVFIGRERKEQPWGSNAENKELRERLWLMSERWTHFTDRMNRLKIEVGEEVLHPTKKTTAAEGESGKKWLWFW